MNPLCKYKDALGEPGKGVHKWRVPPGKGGFAAADLLMTGAAALLLSRTIPSAKAMNPFASFFIIFLILMIVAIIVHRAFCVDTELNKRLGLVAKTD